MQVMGTTATLVRRAAMRQLGGTALSDGGLDRVTSDPADPGRWVGGHHHGVADQTSSADTVDTTGTTPAGAVAPGTAVAEPVTGRPALRLPSKLVFRVPGSSLVAVVFLAMSASWVAVASPWYTLVYLLPLGFAVWVLRTRTVVDADRIVVRRVFSRRELPWSSVASLRVADRKWVRAVRSDGVEVVLPTVRTRHLPALAIVSGGRLSDPTEPAPVTAPAETA
jgi:hypothetical protein